MAQKSKYLIISRHAANMARLKLLLSKSDSTTLLEAGNKSQARSLIDKQTIDVLICDISESRQFLGLIRQFKKRFFNKLALAVSTSSHYRCVAEAFQHRADDFLPLNAEQAEFTKLIDTHRQRLSLSERNQDNLAIAYKEGILRFDSPALRPVFNRVAAIAKNQVETCLIVGENGTGKELFARLIHQQSPRSSKPFIALNCAGLAENLIDSELFGFEKGSFTGAYQSTPGKVELAEGGVLFLDEISEMSVQLQAKLLRLLENREIIRIGGTNTIHFDVMIIATTNRDLKAEIRKGNFREDVYHRLNMAGIELPPLRKRLDVIPSLLDHFFEYYCRKFDKTLKIDREAVLAILNDYHYPGNVRELRNIIHKAVLFCSGKTVGPKDFLKHFSNIEAGGADIAKKPQKRIDDDKIIKEILEETNWNITWAAQKLGYSREGLSRRIKRNKIK